MRQLDGRVDMQQADDTTTLLRAVAEELKSPLLYIARQSELGRQQESIALETLRDMQSNADAALRLVDSYLLGLDIAQTNLELELEPVSLSSLLFDVNHLVRPLFAQHGLDIELALAGRYGQVAAHREAFTAAFMCMSGAIAGAIDVSDDNDKAHRTVTIAVHRTPAGIVAGLYTPLLSRSLQLQPAHKPTTSRTSLPFGTSLSGGAGILVADQLFKAMNLRLRNSHFRGERGLAVTLQPSQQMRFV